MRLGQRLQLNVTHVLGDDQLLPAGTREGSIKKTL